MDDNPAPDSLTHRWYQQRIGAAEAGDEVRGYWVFAVGVILGVAGVLLFLPSASAGPLRETAIALAAAGLALVFVGPVLRLPLRRRATLLVYAGLGLCLLAILWFVLVFPQNWSVATGDQAVIALYALGLLTVGAGGVFVPLLTGRAEAAAERVALAGEVEELREALLDAEADESDLARVVTDLRRALDETTADEADLRAMVERLRGDVADVEADESDLATRLRALQSSQARFEVYEDRGGEFRWRLRHRNGNLVANSGEGYTRRHNARKGLQSVRRNALGATVLHIESEADLPDEDAAFDPVEERPSRATFEVYEDNAGEHRFRLRHENGNVLADSGEGYASRSGARTAIDRIREYVGPADHLRFDPTGFEIYQDNAGEYRWRLVHRNGNILADSGEGYTRRRDARRAVNGVRERIGDAEFDVYEDDAGEHRWRLRAPNGKIVVDSGEGYADRGGAEAAVERVRNHVPEADVLDIGSAAFEVYEDRGGEFRWRLRHRNGNVLADSGEGYAERRNVREGIRSVKRNAPNADTEE